MESIKEKINIKRYFIDGLYIIIGCAIMSIGTGLFLLPNQLSTGGFSGIATIIYYFLGFPLGTTMFVLNLPLFIFSFFRIGKELFIKSIIGTGLLAFFINITEQLEPFTDDRLLAAIYGGVFIGIGLGIILRRTASTGGTDLISYIVKSYKPHFRSSSLIVIVDAIIIGVNVLFFREIEIALYSVIAIFLVGKMIDIVFEGVNFTKMIYIISNKFEEIAKEVDEKIGRGSTGIDAKGMYTKEEKKMLLCVASRNEVGKIKDIAIQIDKSAFIIISNAREAWGKGFKE